MTLAQPLLELRGIRKTFGGITAIADVSVTIQPNSIVGVIGPNGAGKTTLFNVITGAYRADAGDVLFAGKSLAGWPPHRIARRGIARTFQNIRLFAGMTVWEHLLVAQPRRNALQSLLPVRWADPEAWRRAEEALALFGLEPYRSRLGRTLPYGLQRRLEMARAMTAGPQLLLLDEPVAGMDREEAEDMRTLLLTLQARGLTILLIEHDMAFVMGLCESLYVLDFGVLLAQGDPAAVRADPAVLDAYLGSDA